MALIESQKALQKTENIYATLHPLGATIIAENDDILRGHKRVKST